MQILTMVARSPYRCAAGMVMVALGALSASIAAQSPKQWTATRLWAVDGADAGDGFGDIRDYVVAPNGVLWVLDFKDQSIRRYDAKGAPLGIVARSGNGPGELRKANGMVVRHDGSVWVNDPTNRRFPVFGADGKYRDQHLFPILSYGYRWMVYPVRDARVIVESSSKRDSSSPPSSIAVWRTIDETGAEKSTAPLNGCETGKPLELFTASTSSNSNMIGSYPFSYGGGTVVLPDGNVWCASPNSTHAVLQRLGARDTIGRTAGEIAPISVSDAERNAAIAETQKRVAAYQTTNFDAGKVPRRKPGIAALHVDDDGRLWIQHGTRSGLRLTEFDVHDANGRHLGHVSIPGRMQDGMPVRAHGDALWLSVVDEDDVPAIVRFQLRR